MLVDVNPFYFMFNLQNMSVSSKNLESIFFFNEAADTWYGEAGNNL